MDWVDIAQQLSRLAHLRFEPCGDDAIENVAAKQAHEIFPPIGSQARRVGLRDYFGVFVWLPRKLSLLWRHGVPRIH